MITSSDAILVSSITNSVKYELNRVNSSKQNLDNEYITILTHKKQENFSIIFLKDFLDDFSLAFLRYFMIFFANFLVYAYNNKNKKGRRL